MILVTWLALAVAIALTETALRLLSQPWWAEQWASMAASLRAYRSADSDEQRQPLVLRAGALTLRLSAAILLLLATLGLAFQLLPWLLDWNEVQRRGYLLIAVIGSVAWVLLRPTVLRLLGKRRLR
jgi:hypothetical protein